MTIPTDYVFTPGTCAKKDFYGVITAALLAAGWTNVSSLASTDYEVYTSIGNTGDKELVLNLRKGSVATPANDVTTGNWCQFSYRLPTSYTPGASGVAGTFVRPDVWRDIYIAPVAAAGTLPMDTVYDYKIYADANKVIFSIQFPGGTGYSPILVYMGLPDSLYCTENGNRGMLVGTTVNCSTAAGNFMIADTPSGMGSASTCYIIPNICTLAPKNPNNAGKYVVSDIYYGSATEGTRGKLDGVVALPLVNVITGDIITIGTCQYYVLNCHSYGGNSFPSLALAIRTV
jgi:hypothetical protein